MSNTMATLNTSGEGLWSDRAGVVRCVRFDLENLESDEYWDKTANSVFGELRVFFDPSTWQVDVDGLIYTDPQFLTELNKFLKEVIRAKFESYADSDVVYSRSDWGVDYSEQGMQGENYVSFDFEADSMFVYETIRKLLQ